MCFEELVDVERGLWMVDRDVEELFFFEEKECESTL